MYKIFQNAVQLSWVRRVGRGIAVSAALAFLVAVLVLGPLIRTPYSREPHSQQHVTQFVRAPGAPSASLTAMLGLASYRHLLGVLRAGRAGAVTVSGPGGYVIVRPSVGRMTVVLDGARPRLIRAVCRGNAVECRWAERSSLPREALARAIEAQR